jgi:uncharacterized protein involved in tolerance to divalent cations
MSIEEAQEANSFIETMTDAIKEADDVIEDLKSFLGDIKVGLEEYQEFIKRQVDE